MDGGQFGSCLGSQKVKDVLAAGEKLAIARQMTGTPTVYLNGELLQPKTDNSQPPTLNELRGLIEAKAASKP